MQNKSPRKERSLISLKVWHPILFIIVGILLLQLRNQLTDRIDTNSLMLAFVSLPNIMYSYAILLLTLVIIYIMFSTLITLAEVSIGARRAALRSSLRLLDALKTTNSELRRD